MTDFQLQIAGGKTKFLPGEGLEGVASWNFAKAPQAVSVRLSWRTKGKGGEDSEVVQRVQFERPAAKDQQPFRISIPPGPYSFSGKLISLVWSLEAVGEPAGKSNRIDLTVSPTGEEILLHKK